MEHTAGRDVPHANGPSATAGRRTAGRSLPGGHSLRCAAGSTAHAVEDAASESPARPPAAKLGPGPASTDHRRHACHGAGGGSICGRHALALREDTVDARGAAQGSPTLVAVRSRVPGRRVCALAGRPGTAVLVPWLSGAAGPPPMRATTRTDANAKCFTPPDDSQLSYRAYHPKPSRKPPCDLRSGAPAAAFRAPCRRVPAAPWCVAPAVRTGCVCPCRTPVTGRKGRGAAAYAGSEWH